MVVSPLSKRPDETRGCSLPGASRLASTRALYHQCTTAIYCFLCQDTRIGSVRDRKLGPGKHRGLEDDRSGCNRKASNSRVDLLRAKGRCQRQSPGRVSTGSDREEGLKLTHLALLIFLGKLHTPVAATVSAVKDSARVCQGNLAGDKPIPKKP